MGGIVNIIQRNKILKLTRKQYSLIGCVFPDDDRELIEYLYESQHPDEQRCLLIALAAHNLYSEDDISDDDFFEWHGL